MDAPAPTFEDAVRAALSLWEPLNKAVDEQWASDPLLVPCGCATRLKPRAAGGG